MKTELLYLTPDIAKQIMDKHYEYVNSLPEHLRFKAQRNFRPNLAKKYAMDIGNGDWKLTHQGIAISKFGRLLDGQHRLAAIRIANSPVKMLISTDCDDEIFSSLDMGIKRTFSDALQINVKEAEVYSRILRMVGSEKTITPARMQLLVNSPIGKEVRELQDLRLRSRRLASSALVKASIVYHMMTSNNKNYVLQQYKDFIHCNYENMSSSVLNFEKQIASGNLTSTNTMDITIRAHIAFNPANKNKTIIRVRSTAESPEMIEMRAYFRSIIDEAEKEPEYVSYGIYKHHNQ